VRSSAEVEDSTQESKAGHFVTKLGSFDKESLRLAIQAVRMSGPKMAVLVQPLLDAAFAGVAFSCDPLIYSRNESLVVWTNGLAERLVSGQEGGNNLRLSRDGDVRDGVWPGSQKTLAGLVEGLRLLEQKMEQPVDVEWVVDRNDQLWFVQVRPVVLPTTDRIPLDGEVNFTRLPGVVLAHSKIRLRRHAVNCGVLMAPAAIQVEARTQSRFNENHPPEFKNAAGVSIVLLHPERIDCKIIREFAPFQNVNIEIFTRGCRRYAVRRYPKVLDMSDAKHEVLKAGLSVSWVSIVIEQVVWDAYATGIMRKSNDGFIVEIALGHFIPKGVVPTSTIILSPNRKVLSEIWRKQPTIYHFIDGHVVTETPPKHQLHLQEFELAGILKALEPAFEGYEDAALEFGILKDGIGWKAYLIDVAEADKGAIALDTTLINSGVLSAGTCRGRLQKMDCGSITTLDGHLNDRVNHNMAATENIIIVAERTSVDLLPLVGAPGIVGFIFAEGSVLAHLSVVLREKGIPAVVLDDQAAYSSLPIGSCVELNTVSRDLAKNKRVTI
jgi:phosphohistidine swiveling domain-containing protein